MSTTPVPVGFPLRKGKPLYPADQRGDTFFVEFKQSVFVVRLPTPGRQHTSRATHWRSAFHFPLLKPIETLRDIWQETSLFRNIQKGTCVRKTKENLLHGKVSSSEAHMLQ
jgi:hypothetical protein